MKKLLMLGLASLCLATLAACSASKPPVKIETVTITPPLVLLREVWPPDMELKTNLDLLNLAIEQRFIIEQLNADKAALKAFFEE